MTRQKAVAVTLTPDQYQSIKIMAEQESLRVSTFMKQSTANLLRAIKAGNLDESIVRCAVMRTRRPKSNGQA